MKSHLLFFVVLAAATSVQAVNIETVLVGNSGNPADTRYIDSSHPNGVGSVAYPFNIGKTEVTNAQYVAFLNAVAAISDPYKLYISAMSTDSRAGIIRGGSPGTYTYSVKPPALGGTYAYEDKPVVYVSWGSAARFVNWLHNGQLLSQENASTTEAGAYALNGATTDAALNAVTRNESARFWIPSEDEWYKAAYHKNDGVTANYWDYPTRTANKPDNNLPSADTGNSVNFLDVDYTNGNTNYPNTNAGAYGLSGSSYATFDQGGNVWEWDERTFAGPLRGIRGGSWGDYSHYLLASDYYYAPPSYVHPRFGFRFASDTALSGDFNRDGLFNAADYVVWRKSNGSQTDYATWRTNFGMGSPGVGSSVVYSTVSEPSTMLLSLSTFALLATRRRRRG